MLKRFKPKLMKYGIKQERKRIMTMLDIGLEAMGKGKGKRYGSVQELASSNPK